MGQAIKGNVKLRQLQAEQPYCIYCGGETAGTSVDHMPPSVIFDLRQRPKGLEFLACTACNNGASPHEVIVASISRVLPDTEDPQRVEEIIRLAKAVERGNPGLLASMRPSLKQQLDARRASGGNLNALNMSHPRIHEAVLKFGAKLGLALHYECTKRIVPVSGATAVAWFSNHDIAVGKFPEVATKLLEQAKSLVQGKLTSRSQFEYGSIVGDDKRRSAHVAAFRQAFSVAVFTTENAEEFVDKPVAQIFRPGFLIENK